MIEVELQSLKLQSLTATAEEVATLVETAKDTVRRKYGLLLEEEIQYVGFV
ncbi:MAG: hypothetical protein HYW89_04570 [Candidatus Sungiibacteriota bacterium]|uniref:Uncharacterized protein n=1 Tax=Candidatus Sungiibacteriota bacterium TaxID=2750080 RepID=A0A7T5RK92_9BACT|nr:MAG: hypothetical protein HYW89_04570 [Candidatus Sungbacteria bacterium]